MGGALLAEPNARLYAPEVHVHVHVTCEMCMCMCMHMNARLYAPEVHVHVTCEMCMCMCMNARLYAPEVHALLTRPRLTLAERALTSAGLRSSRPHLGHISATSRLHLGGRAQVVGYASCGLEANGQVHCVDHGTSDAPFDCQARSCGAPSTPHALNSCAAYPWHAPGGRWGLSRLLGRSAGAARLQILHTLPRL